MKRRKGIAFLIGIVILSVLFVGCGNNQGQTPNTDTEQTVADDTATTGTSEPDAPASDVSEGTQINVGTIRGPTGMGMTSLMEQAEAGNTQNTYHFTIGGTPEEMTAGILSGELDIVAVPTNVAATLYQVTDGNVQLITVCALGVWSILDSTGTIHTIEDLRGKTINTTGQGATPEFALAYVLRQNNIDPETDVTIVYNTENAELASLMVAGNVEIGMLPQPFVTTVTNQNADIQIALDLNEEWNAVSPDSAIVSSSIIARRDFIEAHPEAIQIFIQEFADSVDFVNNNVEAAADLMEKFDIIPAAVAIRAIPGSNLVHISGADMQPLVNGFLTVLYEANPQSVGGSMPDENFYLTN